MVSLSVILPSQAGLKCHAMPVTRAAQLPSEHPESKDVSEMAHEHTHLHTQLAPSSRLQ